MGIVRLLVRVGILALSGLAAVVVMVILFGVQIRFDQQAELQIRGLDGPATAPATIVAVTAGTTAKADEELASSGAREARRSDDTPISGGAVSRNATASVQPLVFTPEQVNELTGMTSPPEPRARTTPEPRLAEGKKAVTIRVAKSDSTIDVTSPDHWVDVVLTRWLESTLAVNDVVVQNARVLAIDRTDAGRDEAAGFNAVTLEVDTVDAQKLLLAPTIGALSLILRGTDDRSQEAARQVSKSDLVKAEPAPDQDSGFTVVRINRPGAEPSIHRVPKER
jgi:hypothetical protein